MYTPKYAHKTHKHMYWYLCARLIKDHTPCSMYLLWDKKTKEGAIVDPFDPKAIFAKAKELGVKITSVLTTHSHNDHDGGNPLVAKMVQQPHE